MLRNAALAVLAQADYHNIRKELSPTGFQLYEKISCLSLRHCGRSDPGRRYRQPLYEICTAELAELCTAASFKNTLVEPLCCRSHLWYPVQIQHCTAAADDRCNFCCSQNRTADRQKEVIYALLLLL